MLPAGSRGVLLEVDDLPGVLRLHDRLRRAALPGVVDLVPAARTVLVVLDPAVRGPSDLVAALAAADASDRTGGAGGTGTSVGPVGDEPEGEAAVEADVVEVPVVYDGEDLAHVGKLTGWGADGVVARHTATTWTVAFGGFAPGFAYAVADSGPTWSVPRRAEPRTRVPAGSVALADAWTGVYPSASPGGWQLIGRTGVPVWDLRRDPPALLRPGVRVRFVAVAGS